MEDIILITRAAKMDDKKAVELYKSDKTVDEIRAVVNPAPETTPTAKPQGQRDEEAPKPVDTPVDLHKIRADASDDEKKRLNAILVSTCAAKMDDSKAVEYYIESHRVYDA